MGPFGYARSQPAQTVLGGKGSPQSEARKAAGGTENGQVCVLESGQACQSDTICLDEEGNAVEEGPDIGSNLSSDDDSSDSSSDD